MVLIIKLNFTLNFEICPFSREGVWKGTYNALSNNLAFKQSANLVIKKKKITQRENPCMLYYPGTDFEIVTSWTQTTISLAYIATGPSQ